MLTVGQARERILATVVETGIERVRLVDAHGRLLGEDLVAPVPLPLWDNSAMDGYAVRAEDTAAATGSRPVELRIVDEIAAGRAPRRALGAGEASRIMTGAPLPGGANAVVAVEDTDGSRSGTVAIREPAVPGKHVRREGESVALGATVLRKGVELGAGAVGLAAALGLEALAVARRPVVAVICTGDELVEPGRSLGAGQIYGSNGVALIGQIREAGAISLDCGTVADDPEAQVRALREAGERADVVLTTGGVSVGSFDFVKGALAEVGAAADFWKVKMKPGKPLAFGRLGRVPVFGLPGNPVSCMVNFALFVRPWLRRSMGDPTPFLPTLDAVAGADFDDSSMRMRLFRAVVRPGPDGWQAFPAGKQSSGAAVEMAWADGLVVADVDRPSPRAGDVVTVQLLGTRFLDRADPGIP